MVRDTEVLDGMLWTWLKEAHPTIMLLGGQAREERFQLVGPFQGRPQPIGSREVGWVQDQAGSSSLVEGVTGAGVRPGAPTSSPGHCQTVPAFVMATPWPWEES